MHKEHVVYKGPEFTIEWYYNDRGKSQAKAYFDDLDRKRKLDAMELFKAMAEMGKIFNITKFRHEGDGIYAFKPKPDRFLCFFFSGKKLSSRMPSRKNKISCRP